MKHHSLHLKCTSSTTNCKSSSASKCVTDSVAWQINFYAFFLSLPCSTSALIKWVYIWYGVSRFDSETRWNSKQNVTYRFIQPLSSLTLHSEDLQGTSPHHVVSFLSYLKDICQAVKMNLTYISTNIKHLTFDNLTFHLSYNGMHLMW